MNKIWLFKQFFIQITKIKYKNIQNFSPSIKIIFFSAKSQIKKNSLTVNFSLESLPCENDAIFKTPGWLTSSSSSFSSSYKTEERKKETREILQTRLNVIKLVCLSDLVFWQKSQTHSDLIACSSIYLITLSRFLKRWFESWNMMSQR